MAESLSAQIADELSRFLEPLGTALSDPGRARRFLRLHGAPELDEVTEIVDLVDSIGSARSALVAVTTMDPDETGPALVGAGTAAWDVIDALQDVASVDFGLTTDEVVALQSALARIPHTLAIRWLEERAAPVALALRFIGVIDRMDPEDPVETISRDRLETFLNAPLDALADLYAWETGSTWDATRFLDIVAGTLPALGLTPRWGGIPQSWIDNGLIASDHPSVATAGVLKAPLVAFRSPTGRVQNQAGLMLGPLGPTPSAALDGAFLTLWSTFSDDAITIGPVDLEVPIDLDAPTIGIRIHPDGVAPVGAVADTLRFGVWATNPIQIGPADNPTVVLSNVGGALEIAADGSGYAIEAGVDVGVTVEIGGDSFLASIFGPIDVDASIGFRYDSETGLSLELAAGIEIVILPPELPGPVQILQIVVNAGIDPQVVTFGVAVDVTGKLGPLTVSVGGVGLAGSATLDKRSELAWAFRPPTGLGLAIDAGAVSGGGYIDIDVPAGRYFGVVALEALSLGISAYGLIETKRPDIDGWSMLFALFIELSQPGEPPKVQLGFGFTLNGLGGLAGINRTLDADALLSSVRSGTLGAVLFPDDPVGEAPIIMATLESIFPPANDSYVFGPMAKIGWGTPTIIEADIGLAIVLPDLVIALLGSIRAILPRPEVEFVALRLDVAGVLDIPRGTVSMDASLHDSHIAGFALAGDMALRADFSDSQAFLLSIGGFHPAFDPPAGFPAMNRLSLGINAGSVLNVSFQCYAAITSNTVQFGAAFDLSARAMGFEIAGGASFDALIKFSPFELQASVGFYISVTAAGVNLMAVHLDASIIGPNPWHIVGSATFKVLGVKKSVRVDEVIGSREAELPPPTPDLVAEVRDELARRERWQAISSGSSTVQLLDADSIPDPDAPLRVRPDGVVEVGQTVVPLNTQIERYGNANLDGIDTFTLEPIGDMTVGETTQDLFAPAQYYNFNAKEKLAQPSFAPMDAGIRFGSDAVAEGAGQTLAAGHAEFIVDPERPDVEMGTVKREPDRHTLLGADNPIVKLQPDAASFTLVEKTWSRPPVATP